MLKLQINFRAVNTVHPGMSVQNWILKDNTIN